MRRRKPDPLTRKFIERHAAPWRVRCWNLLKLESAGGLWSKLTIQLRVDPQSCFPRRMKPVIFNRYLAFNDHRLARNHGWVKLCDTDPVLAEQITEWLERLRIEGGYSTVSGGSTHSST